MSKPDSASSFSVHDPLDGELLARLAFADDAAIGRALASTGAAFARTRVSTAHARAQVLEELARLLGSRRDEFVDLIRREAGKPVRYATIEVDRALGVLAWAGGEARRFGGEVLRLDTTAGGRAGLGVHSRFARGVVLGITPFNFPLNLLLHKVAPAIASGCAILVKPSPATPLTALRFKQLFDQAARGSGLEDAFDVVLADDAATERLTRAPEIAMISFTGSARVGHLIRAQSPLKHCTLELGGNAWVAVLDDVASSDLPAIARRIAAAGYGYAGQSCIAVQNIAVSARHWPELSELLAEATRQTAYGDTAHAETVSGPLIRARDAERVRQLLVGVPAGARQVSSTRAIGDPARAGLVAPTLVLVPSRSRGELVEEEAFGPVMTAQALPEGPDAAVAAFVAEVNRSRYGLQAGVFTNNLVAIETLYRDLEVGGVVVNDAPTTRYDHQPYGGVKESGEGREGVRYAMDDMTTSKFLALSSRIPN